MNLITIIWVMIGVMVLVLIAGVSWAVYYFRVYRFKVELYQNIRGTKFERVKVYRARLLDIPDSYGEKVLWVPKAKMYCSAYGQMMGKNTYWQVVGQDGYWYNCVLGDFDAKLGMLDIEPVDRDVRAFHTANNKNIKERYNKPKNWPVVLMSFTIIFALLIVFAGGYFMYSKVQELQSGANANLQASENVVSGTADVVLEMKELVRALRGLPEQSSGLVRVNSTNG
jgi:flagellar basal body-associated protein FliL